MLGAGVNWPNEDKYGVIPPVPLESIPSGSIKDIVDWHNEVHAATAEYSAASLAVREAFTRLSIAEDRRRVAWRSYLTLRGLKFVDLVDPDPQPQPQPQTQTQTQTKTQAQMETQAQTETQVQVQVQVQAQTQPQTPTPMQVEPQMLTEPQPRPRGRDKGKGRAIEPDVGEEEDDADIDYNDDNDDNDDNEDNEDNDDNDDNDNDNNADGDGEGIVDVDNRLSHEEEVEDHGVGQMDLS
jgi:hypothetical protein